MAGRLRIGVPKIYMMSTLQPVVSDFMLEFPEVTLDLVLTEGRSDLHQDGLDAAIMGGRRRIRRYLRAGFIRSLP